MKFISVLQFVRPNTQDQSNKVCINNVESLICLYSQMYDYLMEQS